MAGEPAALLRETRHLAVVDHDRHAVLVDAGLLAFLHHLVELGIAVDLPLLAVETQVLVLAAREVVEGLPLEAQVGILVVERGLHREILVAVLALDRHRLQTAAFHQLVADVLFRILLVVTGDAGYPRA